MMKNESRFIFIIKCENFFHRKNETDAYAIGQKETTLINAIEVAQGVTPSCSRH